MDQYTTFLENLKRKFDVDLLGYKRPQMERRINSLMRTLEVADYDQLVQTMAEDQVIFNRFLTHLTINVSEFFRNPSQWDVLKNKILPLLLKDTQNLKIWSAGCSTGEEPYSLAMVLKEHFPLGRHTILATDFDKNVLSKAKEGVYSAKEISGIPDYYRKKYVDQVDGTFKIKNSLKDIIKFKEHNLLTSPFEKNFDLILCRNVVIYFTEETKDVLYRKFYQALKNQGVLFTGSTEQIIQARDMGFNSIAIFFYQKQL